MGTSRRANGVRGQICDCGTRRIAASASPALWAKRNSSSPTSTIQQHVSDLVPDQRASAAMP